MQDANEYAFTWTSAANAKITASYLEFTTWRKAGRYIAPGDPAWARDARAQTTRRRLSSLLRRVAARAPFVAFRTENGFSAWRVRPFGWHRG